MFKCNCSAQWPFTFTAPSARPPTHPPTGLGIAPWLHPLLPRRQPGTELLHRGGVATDVPCVGRLVLLHPGQALGCLLAALMTGRQGQWS